VEGLLSLFDYAGPCGNTSEAKTFLKFSVAGVEKPRTWNHPQRGDVLVAQKLKE